MNGVTQEEVENCLKTLREDLQHFMGALSAKIHDHVVPIRQVRKNINFLFRYILATGKKTHPRLEKFRLHLIPILGILVHERADQDTLQWADIHRLKDKTLASVEGGLLGEYMYHLQSQKKVVPRAYEEFLGSRTV